MERMHALFDGVTSGVSVVWWFPPRPTLLARRRLVECRSANDHDGDVPYGCRCSKSAFFSPDDNGTFP